MAVQLKAFKVHPKGKNMFTGATVIVTIVSALGLGILAGWAVLASVLHVFFATKSAAEAKVSPQRVTSPVNVAAHTA